MFGALDLFSAEFRTSLVRLQVVCVGSFNHCYNEELIPFSFVITDR